jgi:dynein heavy chain
VRLQPPEDGAYIDGMYVEGARWDPAAQQLADSLPKVLHSAAPLMLLEPCEVSKQVGGEMLLQLL